MIQHRHHIEGRALRLLLANLRSPLDSLKDSYMILINEIGDCSFCWFLVADELASMIRAEITAQVREHPHKNLEGYVRWYERHLVEQLDHADDDDEDAA